jgi:EmrB/QacA subfamily drug resistance transporter
MTSIHPNKRVILWLLALTIFLVVLDSAIVNVALPAIKVGLHFDDASLQWVLTSYILTFGGFLMLGGRTADLYGRRRVLVAGIGGFTLCSLLIGLSTTSTMMIVFRTLQGLAAAFMAPTALSILLTTFEEGPERYKALSIWSIVASGGAAAGVFLGGVLTQYLGWQWCFFVNVPVGIAAMYFIKKNIPAQIKEATDKHLDLPGAILITGGLMALVYGLTVASSSGWTAPSTLISFTSSIVLLAAFLFNETKSKHPLVPLGIFRTRNVVGGNLMLLPVMAGAMGQFFFLSQYIQEVLKYPPSQSGLSFLPIPLIIGVISYNSPKLLGKFGFKPLLIVGTCLITAGIFLMSFIGTDTQYFTHLLPAFILLACGFGITFVSITVAATSGVAPDKSGLVAGLINTAQQIGGALGLAILAMVARSATVSSLAAGQTATQAAVQGYHYAFLTASALMVVALMVGIFIIRTPAKKESINHR